jgi:hypothetical protein
MPRRPAVPAAKNGDFAMTPLAGFIIAIVAGWIVPDARRAAAIVIIPWAAVLAAQTWIIAAGRAVSPPSTVSQFPRAVGYWAVQAVFLALALGIAWQLAVLRARRAVPSSAAGGVGRRMAVASGPLATASAVFAVAWLLDSAPVRHHATEGAPPVLGVAGMALCIATFVVLSVLTLRHRRAAARARAAAVVPGTGLTAPGARR